MHVRDKVHGRRLLRPPSTSMVPLGERWNGKKWARQPTPNPWFPPGGNNRLSGVSCASATACMATGYNDDRGTVLALRWNGKTWASKTLTQPHGAGWLYGVSCASARACIAVGAYHELNPSFGPELTLAERWNGKSWAIQTLPSPV